MKKWVVFLAMLCLLVSASCNSVNQPQDTATLQTVSDTFGIPVPQPKLLPSGFSLDEVVLSDNNTALLMYGDGSGDELEFKMDWFPGGGVPYKIDDESPNTITLPGFAGKSETVDGHQRIIWNLQYESTQINGLMICYLSSTSEISIEELAEIAASVGWD